MLKTVMRFLNPKTDFAFKRIFGSEHSHDILLSFLNALLDLEGEARLQEVEILDPYVAPKIRGMKDTFLDVKVRDGRGRTFIIEMQVLNVPGFEKRILYNACKTYAGQILKGDKYDLLNDVIAITITDFVMFPAMRGVLNRFKLRAAQGEVYADDLELIFVELPKFEVDPAELKSTSEGLEEGLEQGRDAERLRIAGQMLQSGLDAEAVAAMTGLAL